MRCPHVQRISVRRSLPEVTPPDRTLGWIVALSSVVLTLERIPSFLAQARHFEMWWILLSGLLFVLILVLAVGGRRLPGVSLRCIWIAIPILGGGLTLTWALAYTEGPLPSDSSFDPWIRSMGPGIVTYLVLLLPLSTAICASVAVPMFALISPLLLWGADSQLLYPQVFGTLAFVVIFGGIRTRLHAIDRAEALARLQRDRELRASERFARQQELGRLVHDEVLSVLAGALQAQDFPSRELRQEARTALHALQDAEQHAVPSQVVAGENGAGDLLRELHEIAPQGTTVHRSGGELRGIPAGVTYAMSMAAREAVRNATRHAGASSVTVELFLNPQQWVLRVVDRGPGFDIDAIPLDRFGLRESLIGRMRAVGGQAAITTSTSSPSGTQVELSWPA